MKMKRTAELKKALRVLTFTTVCLIFVVACFLSAAAFHAFADDVHTHEFTGSRCECGAALFEAEDADLSGSVPSPGNDTNIGSNAAASGGKLVNNWSVTGNKIVWRFSLDKAAVAPMDLVMSPCEGETTFSSTLSLTVNGVGVTMKSDAIRGIVGEQWHNYTPFTTNDVSFAEGNVEIILEAKRAYNVNIDCLIVGLAPNVTVGEYDPEVPHTHEFTGSRCECGAVKLEAENAQITGTPAWGNTTFLEQNVNSSGGWNIANWRDGNNILTFNLDVSKAAENVTLGLVIAGCQPPSGHILPTTEEQLNNKGSALWAFEMRVNGQKTSFTSHVVPTLGSDNNYHNWKTVWTNPINLNAGTNSIDVEAWDYYSMNIDYLIIEVTSDVDITMLNLDNVAPEISAITVDPADPKAGSEVSFSFTVTDNISATENIEISVKVYLNYGKSTQTEIICVNNKFTPEEEGKYTIIVTATDEAGKSSEKQRVVNVMASDGTSDPLPSDDPPGPGPGEENKGCFGLISGGGITAAIIMVLIGLALVAVFRRKANKR